MGLKRGGIKDLEGLGREDWVVGKKYRRCGNGRVAADFFIFTATFFVNPPPPSILIWVQLFL